MKSHGKLESRCFGFLFGLILATGCLSASAASIEERLDRMQKTLDAVTAENRELKARVASLERERPADVRDSASASPEISDQFREKVSTILKEQKPSPFVLPLGQETVLKLGGYIQGQAEFGDVDAWLGRFPGGPNGNRNDDRFRIRRTRVSLAGDFGEDFDFKVVGDFANTDGSANRQSTFSAIDIFANWHRFPEVQVKVGQFTAPFGGEQVTPDIYLYTPERALVSDSLTPDRLVGVQIWGFPFARALSEPYRKVVEYRFGLFNGNGRNRGFNDNESFLYAGRLQLNAWKPHTLSYSENLYVSAGKSDPRLSVGVNGLFEDQSDHGTPLVFLGNGGVPSSGPRFLGDGSLVNSFTFGSDYRRAAIGADLAARYGPFDVIAEYLQERFTPRVINARDAEFTARGFYITAGMFLPIFDRRFQFVEKFEHYDPSNLTPNDEIATLTSGLNWYIKGDNIKLMLDWLHTWSEARNTEFDLAMVRMQLMF